MPTEGHLRRERARLRRVLEGGAVKGQVCGCCPPALGHRFDLPDLRCPCGRSWHAQRRVPAPCPRALSALQRLEGELNAVGR